MTPWRSILLLVLGQKQNWGGGVSDIAIGCKGERESRVGGGGGEEEEDLGNLRERERERK